MHAVFLLDTSLACCACTDTWQPTAGVPWGGDINRQNILRCGESFAASNNKMRGTPAGNRVTMHDDRNPPIIPDHQVQNAADQRIGYTMCPARGVDTERELQKPFCAFVDRRREHTRTQIFDHPLGSIGIQSLNGRHSLLSFLPP